jgi:predicted aconitase
VRLDDRDQAMLAGEFGPAKRLALRILVRYGRLGPARELLDISAAHIDSSLYLGDATLDFAERLVDMGARVAVPSTLNVAGVDECGYRHWDVPEEHAAKARRQMLAYHRMGCEPTWTCAPYQTAWRPRFGQQIAWGESNAIVFANSAIGARTERYPDLVDICAALAGRVPAAGLHLAENRAGQLLVRLRGVPERLQRDSSFYPVLGHLLGKIAQDRIPVLEGLEARPEEDQMKALCAAAASSGAVALLHVAGVTPEAPTVREAFQGRAPSAIVDLGLADLRAARSELTTAPDSAPRGVVAVGSPHFSAAEFAELAALVRGERRHESVRVLVTSSRAMVERARASGDLAALASFGATVTVDTCVLTTPMLRPGPQSVMTNSAKYAYYGPGLLGRRMIFGSLADCVRSAIAGRVVRDESLWAS